MDDHRYSSSRHSTSEAIRDAVRAEDPATWGTRELSTPMRPSTMHGTAHDTRAADHGRTGHGSTGLGTTGQSATGLGTSGYGTTSAATGPAATGPIATDPTPATYTGSTVDTRADTVRDRDLASTTSYGAAPTYGTQSRVIEEDGRIAHAEPPVERRRFSIGATFLGWAVAAFFTLVFSTIGLALVGGNAFNDDGQLSFTDANGIVIGSLVAYLIATFLAYLIGGYAAGRIALWDGVKHGLGTVAWAVLFAILAVIAGSALADTFNVQNYLSGFDLSALTGETVLAIVLSLAAMLGGAALGGKMGERYHDRVHGIDRRRTHRAGRLRGRPL